MKAVRRRACLAAILILALTGTAGPAAAASPPQAAPDGPAGELVVNYPATFFDRYNPNTALDMIRQVPGFQPDDGASQRGFGGAAGNLLINDRRPSAKQDKPTSILSRIPASNVARIELIRGKVRDIDLLGYSTVANVILRKEAPAAVRWEAAAEKSAHHVGPRTSISLSDAWRGVDYNLGLNYHGHIKNFSNPGSENVYDGAGSLTERRAYEDASHQLEGFHVSTYLNASTWLGRNHVQFNGLVEAKHQDDKLIIHHRPLGAAAPGADTFINQERSTAFELGLDAERELGSDLLGKAIVLVYRENADPFKSERDLDAAGRTLRYKRAETSSDKTEAIARTEFNWTGRDNHSVQLNLEGDYNVLDNSLLQTEDGVVVDVPNGNVRVEEVRGDFLLQDTWTLGSFELEYGLGAETSTLSETGDTRLKRRFFFLKPRAVLSWSPDRQRQTRLRIEREVAQLDFKDFASATVFEDNDVALGNPNLRPDTTWVAELSQEWRFGKVGVVKITAFHHWISDVLDLLPVSATDEVPGNIGSARRWGLQMEDTLPLDWLYLRDARLDIKARWQDSTVTDPVTGRSRVLSAHGGVDAHVDFNNDNEWMFSVDFRQDFRAARWAWGWTLAQQADRPLYKVNELQIYHEGLHFDAFLETTRWLGMKIRLDAINLLDYEEGRDRTVYVGERDLTPVAYREVKSLHKGRRVLLSLSGTF